MKNLFGLLVVMVLVGCNAPPLRTPQPVVSTAAVTVYVTQVEREVTREVTVAPSATPKTTATVAEVFVTVGNTATNPTATSWDCAENIWNTGPIGFVDQVLNGEYPAVQVFQTATQHWVQVRAEGTKIGTCWLSEVELTLSEGWNWNKLPVYIPPTEVPPATYTAAP